MGPTWDSARALRRNHPSGVRIATMVVAGFVLMMMPGCAPRLPVTGSVVDQGKPLPGATILFISKEDPDRRGSAVSDENGRFIVESGGRAGLWAGPYEVQIRWHRTRDGKPLHGEEGANLLGTVKAVSYSATLEVQIGRDQTTLTLDVTGKGTIVRD